MILPGRACDGNRIAHLPEPLVVQRRPPARTFATATLPSTSVTLKTTRCARWVRQRRGDAFTVSCASADMAWIRDGSPTSLPVTSSSARRAPALLTSSPNVL